MKKIINEYRNLPGQHCGSTAMRNLLYHYCQLELSEAVIFGLGSGIDCIFLENKKFIPPIMVFGRNITMEMDLGIALGVDYQETPELNNQKAWEEVKKEITQGSPVMLSGDSFYLDYRDFKVHFPSHRFVMVGFDDQKEMAYIADRLEPEIQACSYKAMTQSRNPPIGISTYNLWGKFYDTQVKHSFQKACLLALKKTLARMFGEDTSQSDLLKGLIGGPETICFTGLQGLKHYAQNVANWEHHPTPEKLTLFAAKCIEKFGTGGGNFRTLYKEFLQWAQKYIPIPNRVIEEIEQSSKNWTQLFFTLENLSQSSVQKNLWKKASNQLQEIYKIETEAFSNLKESLADLKEEV